MNSLCRKITFTGLAYMLDLVTKKGLSQRLPQGMDCSSGMALNNGQGKEGEDLRRI